MFSLLACLIVLVLLVVFRKAIFAWLKSPSDPFAAELEKIEAKEQAVFGKRTAAPAPVADSTTTKAP